MLHPGRRFRTYLLLLIRASLGVAHRLVRDTWSFHSVQYLGIL